MKKNISFLLVFVIFCSIFCACSGDGVPINNSSSVVNAEKDTAVISSNTQNQSEIKSDINSSSETQESSAVSQNPQNSNGNTNNINSNSNNNNYPESSSNKVSNVSSEEPPLVDMSNLSAAKIEAFNDEQIAWIHSNADKFPENFAFKELSGYGRVVSSAASADEALRMIEDRFTTSTYITTKCELLIETDYFYGVYVRWDPRDTKNSKNYLDEKVVCFKENVCDYQNIQYSDDIKKGNMVIRDATVIKQILDYGYYSNFYKIGGYKVLYSELNETSENYNYTIYYLGTVYGDWNIKDEVTLYKQETVIPKSNGVFERSEKQELRMIKVIGEGILSGEGFVGE